MLNTGCGFPLCSAWRKMVSISHPQGGRSIAYHTKGMRILLVQRMRWQKHIEVIGAKNVAINANTNSLNLRARNYRAHSLKVQTKQCRNLIKTTAVKVCMNISKQVYSQKEAESNHEITNPMKGATERIGYSLCYNQKLENHDSRQYDSCRGVCRAGEGARGGDAVVATSVV